MNYEFESIWIEAVAASVEVLLHYLPGRIEENHEQQVSLSAGGHWNHPHSAGYENWMLFAAAVGSFVPRIVCRSACRL